MSYYRPFRRKSLVTAVLITGAILFCLRLSLSRVSPPPQSERGAGGDPHDCSQLPGANDTLVILKTGATELQDKLPVHFHTTLLCYPNYIIFSDLEEEFEGHHIIDALDFVDPVIKQTDDDFELWRRLQEHGRSVLAPDELSGPESKVSPMTGKGSNPGWKLDKWKFLPMVNRTLELYPDMKWYIFVETDTYMFWSTALAWINTLDHTKPYYLGSQMQIGEVIFGHGGSGVVVSQTALRMVVNHFKLDQTGWERFTKSHWAGDCVLGKAFREAGAPLGWAWPTIQGVKPGSISYDKYDYGKRLWCYPTMSYHHLSPAEVEDIWWFEQEWLKNVGDFLFVVYENFTDRLQEPNLIRHKDVFKSYILPHIQATKGTKTKWDNLSGKFEEAPGAKSFEECRWLCKGTADCVQYAFSDGTCAMSETPRWGESNPAVQSGWFVDRVEQFMAAMKPCEDELWVTV